jgi:hypothetical protein
MQTRYFISQYLKYPQTVKKICSPWLNRLPSPVQVRITKLCAFNVESLRRGFQIILGAYTCRSCPLGYMVHNSTRTCCLLCFKNILTSSVVLIVIKYSKAVTRPIGINRLWNRVGVSLEKAYIIPCLSRVDYSTPNYKTKFSTLWIFQNRSNNLSSDFECWYCYSNNDFIFIFFIYFRWIFEKS